MEFRNSILIPGIPMEFYANLFVIPKIIPNNSMEFQKMRDANPLRNSGWFGLRVSKIYYFAFGFGFQVFKNPILSLGSGSGFKNFPKNRVLGSGWVFKNSNKIFQKF
jgi:hypothetical protein